MDDQYSLEQGWFFHNHAWHLLHEIIKKIDISSKTLLDVGAGTGLAASVIHAVIPFIDVSVCDVSENCEEYWSMRDLPGIIIENNILPFDDNNFDTVISSHVIEHLEKPMELTREMFRVCKKRLIIIVPDGDVHFYDHKIIYNRTVLNNIIENALLGMEYKKDCFPVYHIHMNNLMAVIYK